MEVSCKPLTTQDHELCFQLKFPYMFIPHVASSSLMFLRPLSNFTVKNWQMSQMTIFLRPFAHI